MFSQYANANTSRPLEHLPAFCIQALQGKRYKKKKPPFKEILLLVEKAFQGGRLTTQCEGKPHKAVEGVCARTRCGVSLNASQRGRSGRRPPAAAVTKAADVCTAAATSGTLQVLSHWHSEAAAIRARGAPSELQRSCYLYGRPVGWRVSERRRRRTRRRTFRLERFSTSGCTQNSFSANEQERNLLVCRKHFMF